MVAQLRHDRDIEVHWDMIEIV